MPDLVALDTGGGQAFVDALAAVWEAGDAAFPLDPRLPEPVARALLGVVRPARIVGPDGASHPLHTGGGDALGVEEGDALVVATSGSTGAPKGVVLTHAAVAASARLTSTRLGVDPGRHRWLACLPLAHIGGLSVVTRALLTGTGLTVLAGFDAEEVAGCGRRRAASHVSLVPTALRRIDPALFECILLGGAAPPEDVPGNAVVTYGMTETGAGVVYDGVPLDSMALSIGTGRAGQGAAGEVLVKGPTLLRAYRDGTRDATSEGTDPTVPGPDGLGGWLPTGDGGRIGGDGRLVVDGRLAEVVNTGGEKVWPAAVERVLSKHPAVADVAVWKRPDPEWGERVVAWVVPADAAAPPRRRELAELVSGAVAPWAAPKELVVVAALPRTASGKVRRADLA